MVILLPGLGLLGTFLTTRTRKNTPIARKSFLSISALTVLLVFLLLALGCGGSSGNKSTSPSQANLMVTGTSGSISHSTVVAVTVN